jgi:hypothetical protein
MKFTLEIPEAEYKRYSQYYKPYIVSMEHDTKENERAKLKRLYDFISEGIEPPTESELQAVLDSWGIPNKGAVPETAKGGCDNASALGVATSEP